ncbi:Planctomycete cytochrome C [Anatilimnocola aggregata]|uniref:Planctomycete cytochrome C n=2 Tax=Anatilimnocola aggregata TaxID=2528021 RepID=A0A517YH10_9BACT|nr:Planctomycete cytochrome C [Anatilimnocola aggregata]
MFAPPRRSSLALSTAIALVFGTCGLCCAETPTPAGSEGLEFFEKRIRPILVAHCYECHSADRKKQEGGLFLDSRSALLKGGDSGPAIIPGDPEKSLLITAVRHADKDLKMPPEQKLSATQLDDLTAWVKQGAPDPRLATSAGTVDSRPKSGMTLEEGRKFWAFQPVQDRPVPAVTDQSWPLTPIDNFILNRLELAGVAAAPRADKRTLLRRVTFDLTGLPPTPNDLAEFLADDSPQAFEKVIDRLLSSPHYGERWGRHWLDVVRYADTCGNASDYPVPQAHRYRDWVISAFNRNLPYDQFVREQIAGDLLGGESEEIKFERIKATGYLAIARRFGGDRVGEHHLTIEDTIDNVGRAFLGSTISCARCHDHKFDPFTSHDYYGLYGIFSSTRYPFPGAEVGRQQVDFVPLMTPAAIDELLKPHREKVAAAEAEVNRLQAVEAEAKKLPDSDEKKTQLEAAAKALKEARQKHQAVQKEAPPIADAYAVAEAKPENAKIHLRGDPKRLGDEVPRHFPAILGGQELPPENATSGRLQLAEWLSSPQNPLTARVMVNRIWQQHFGKGIVQTPNDFGRQGKPPTHPELLDYLAARFVESGWSIKAMHKQILLSRTWQLTSEEVATSARLDPNNELFWKFTRRRLDAEALRDSILFVSGQLDETPAGAHPFPPAASWGFTQHNPFNAVYETRRRSVYLMQQRLRKNPYLAIFDGADPSSSTAVRLPSTTPLQALFLMNDSFAHDSAAKLAALAIASQAEEPKRIEFLYQTTLTRAPNSEEVSECSDFLQKYRAALAAKGAPPPQVEPEAWSALARVLLSGNEFAFVD